MPHIHAGVHEVKLLLSKARRMFAGDLVVDCTQLGNREWQSHGPPEEPRNREH